MYNIYCNKKLQIRYLWINSKTARYKFLFFKNALQRTIQWSSVGEWLGRLLKVLGLDDSSLLIALQKCDGLNSPYT